MYLGGQGSRPEEAIFQPSLNEQQCAANQDWEKTVLGGGGSKCKVVKSGRSLVLLKAKRQPEWLTQSKWVRWGNGMT